MMPACEILEKESLFNVNLDLTSWPGDHGPYVIPYLDFVDSIPY